MNDGTNRKVPAAVCCAALFVDGFADIQYQPVEENSQCYLRQLFAVNSTSSTIVARSDVVLTPVRWPRRHGDTPCVPQRPRLARRDARGCGPELPAQPHAPPQKSETAGRGFPAGSVVIWSQRPLTSVVRAFAPG